MHTFDFNVYIYMYIHTLKKKRDKPSFGFYKFISAANSIGETASSDSHHTMKRKKFLYFSKDSHNSKKKDMGRS